MYPHPLLAEIVVVLNYPEQEIEIVAHIGALCGLAARPVRQLQHDAGQGLERIIAIDEHFHSFDLSAQDRLFGL